MQCDPACAAGEPLVGFSEIGDQTFTKSMLEFECEHGSGPEQLLQLQARGGESEIRGSSVNTMIGKLDDAG